MGTDRSRPAQSQPALQSRTCRLATPSVISALPSPSHMSLGLCLQHPEIIRVWADQGYSGELVAWTKDTLGLLLRISKKPPGQTGFKVLPRRWIVERSLSWIAQAAALCVTTKVYRGTPKHWSIGPPSP